MEGRRNRCTRQRDADRRVIPLFFSRPFFCSSSSSFFTSPLAHSAAALPLPSLSFSLEPSVITVQSLGFYRRSDVATGSRGFRPDVGMIEKSIRTGRSYIPDVDAVVRCSFSKIFIFRPVVLSSND